MRTRLTPLRPCSTFNGPRGDFLFFSGGPRVIDAALVTLDESDSDAADANGCAAKFTEATGYVRLIFGAGVREKDAAGALVDLGTEASAERANKFFSVKHGGAEIVGVADVDPDNVVDVCIKGGRRKVLLQVRCGAVPQVPAHCCICRARAAYTASAAIVPCKLQKAWRPCMWREHLPYPVSSAGWL